jgi:tripartite-type tricarboxylate transporter receptor subunit TctC
MAESGFADYAEEDVWFGIVAPAKTSRDNLAQLTTLLSDVMKSPAMEARLAPLELYPTVMCGTDFGAYLRRQHDEYRRIVREVKMNVE